MRVRRFAQRPEGETRGIEVIFNLPLPSIKAEQLYGALILRASVIVPWHLTGQDTDRTATQRQFGTPKDDNVTAFSLLTDAPLFR